MRGKGLPIRGNSLTKGSKAGTCRIFREWPRAVASATKGFLKEKALSLMWWKKQGESHNCWFHSQLCHPITACEHCFSIFRSVSFKLFWPQSTLIEIFYTVIQYLHTYTEKHKNFRKNPKQLTLLYTIYNICRYFVSYPILCYPILFHSTPFHSIPYC